MEHAIFIVTGGLTPSQRSLQLFMCLRRVGIFLPTDLRLLLHTYIERLPSRQDYECMVNFYSNLKKLTPTTIWIKVIAHLVLEKRCNFNLADIYIYILEHQGYDRKRRLETGKAIFDGSPRNANLNNEESDFCMLEYAFYSEIAMDFILSNPQFHSMLKSRDTLCFSFAGAFGGRLLDILLKYPLPLYSRGWNDALKEDLTGNTCKLLGQTFKWGMIDAGSDTFALNCIYRKEYILLLALLKLKLVDMFSYCTDGLTILQHAISSENAACVLLILNNGGSYIVNTLSRDGKRSPLWMAMAAGDMMIFELLVIYGADPNMTNVEGQNIYTLLETVKTHPYWPKDFLEMISDVIDNALKHREEYLSMHEKISILPRTPF